MNKKHFILIKSSLIILVFGLINGCSKNEPPAKVETSKSQHPLLDSSSAKIAANLIYGNPKAGLEKAQTDSFNRYLAKGDKNQNGRFDKEECTKGRGGVICFMFERYDTNHDHSVDLSEFLAFGPQEMQQASADMKEALASKGFNVK